MLRMGGRNNKMLGRYAIGDELGRGSSARVFKALNSETGEFVAVKQMPSSGMSREEMLELASEVELMKLLKHPNIVNYLETITTKDYLYIVLEYVENGSLASILRKFGSFPEQLVSIYVTQVLDGLAYLHEQGVIHRDIKGANILITKEGTVKLADFGVATKVTDDADRSNSAAGTPYWMAPEIIKMSGFTTASDIWSLGCTCIELLTGEPPYFDLAPMSALFRIVQDEHPPLPADVSPTLRDFCLKCFEKSPELRPTAVLMTGHPWITSTKAAMGMATAVADDQGAEGAGGAVRRASFGADPASERPDAIAADAMRMLQEGQAEEARDRFEKAKTSTIQLAAIPLTSPAAQAAALAGANVTVRGEQVAVDMELLERTFGPGGGGATGAGGGHQALPPPPPPPQSGHAASGAGGGSGGVSACAGGAAAGGAAAADAGGLAERDAGGAVTRRSSEVGNGSEQSRASRHSSVERLSGMAAPNLADMSPSDRAAAMIAMRSPMSPQAALGERRTYPSVAPAVGNGGFGFGLGDVRVDELARRLEPYTERPGDDDYSALVRDAGASYAQRETVPRPTLGTGPRRVGGPPTPPHASGHVRLLDDPGTGVGADHEAGVTEPRGGAGATNSADWDHAGVGPGGDTGGGGPAGGDVAAAARARHGNVYERLLARRMRTFWHEEAAGGLTDYFASVPAPNDNPSELAAHERDLEARRAEVHSAIAKIRGDALRMDVARDVAPAVRQCSALIRHRPTLAAEFGQEHGLMPLIELLQQAALLPLAQQSALAEPLLELCNELAASGTRYMCENLCLLSAVPAVAGFVGAAGMTAAAHMHICRFLNTMCRAGPATLAMLVASDALPVLVQLMDAEHPQRREQTALAVDSVWCLFQMRSWKAPRSDFCRLLKGHGALQRLPRVLHMASRSDLADGRYQDTVLQAADVLLLFSHAEESVARGMLDLSVLQDMLLVLSEPAKFAPRALLTVLKCVKNLSMGPDRYVIALQRAGAVVTLVFFLDAVADDAQFALEMRGQALLSLYHLCKLNRLRQEQAVVCPPSRGIVPHLQDAVVRSTQLKYVALPMLCDIARASKRSRTELWKHSGAGFYLELLAQEAWRDDALEALAAWLADEPRKVEAILEKPDSIKLLVEVLDTQTPATFENLLESLRKILNASSRVNQALGDSRFVPKLVERLTHPTPVIRVNLLRMLTSIYEHHREPKRLIVEYDLLRVVERMIADDKAVLVKEIAGQLHKAFKASDYI